VKIGRLDFWWIFLAMESDGGYVFLQGVFAFRVMIAVVFLW
jgi:hypothetical protein